MRTVLPFAVVCWVLAMAGIARAQSQRVVLLRPPASEPVLVDSFNRLVAELQLHHFETQFVAADAEDDPASALDRAADASNAVASIAFLTHADTAAVEVRFVDGVSGETTLRRVEVGRTHDAASVLAIRAVDLLRVNLPGFEPEERPTTTAPSREPWRAPEPAREVAVVEQRLRLRVEALALFDGPRFGLAYGPALGVHYVTGPFEIGLMLAGPLAGADIDTVRGSATVTQELVWLDARFRLVKTRDFSLTLGAGAGAHFLQARGQANAPLLSRDDDLYGAFGAAGLHEELALSRTFALTASVRALVLVPPLGVAVATERAELGTPLVAASVGGIAGW
jgi:hypothetical protein